MQKRTLFIGDVHGCYDELIELVEKIALSSADRLYFVGDLINKGPKSLEVVEWVRSRPNTWSVIGNHEYYSLMDEETYSYLLSQSDAMSEGRRNWIETQYEKSRPLREVFSRSGHIDYLRSLPVMIEQEEFLLVHGGLQPEYGLITPVEIATMIRTTSEGKPWYEYYTSDKLIIYGHWAAEGLRVRNNTIGLDTGCCFGGALTAYCIETNEYWQVRANKVYKEPIHWREKSESEE